MNKVRYVSILTMLVIMAESLSFIICLGESEGWEKTFSAPNSVQGYSVRQTENGGYIVLGGTWTNFSAQNRDLFLVKTDAEGNMLWNKTYGGTGFEEARSIQVTSDGGYIAAGTIVPERFGDWAVYLVRFDALGQMLWYKTYGGSESESGSSVQVTGDGGYIVAGNTNSFGVNGDIYLVKTDNDGNMLWNETYGGERRDDGSSVQVTDDGGYIVAGSTNSFGAGGYDFYLVKTDDVGNKLWDKTYGGTGDDYALSVQDTADGGYIIAGNAGELDASSNKIFLVKTDGSGEVSWDKIYSHEVGACLCYSVQETSDGGYIVAGSTDSGGGSMLYLMKVDASGNLLWEKTYGGWVNTMGMSVQVTDDCGCIVAGTLGRDAYLVKVSAVPPAFKLSGLTVDPFQVEVNMPIIVSVNVKNMVDLSGNYSAELRVNGTIEESKKVTLTGGEETVVSFTIIKPAAGTYRVSVGSLSGSFQVNTKSTPTPTPSPSPSPSQSPTHTPSPSPTQGGGTGGGIPSFPFESIIMGIVIGIILLWVLQRKR